MFALALSFYSARTYEYMGGVFSLPHTNFFTEWTFLINCKLHSFMDIFRRLKARINQNPSQKECSLLCDVMSIKSFVYYHYLTDNYDDYVNYGEGIFVLEEDIVPKVALVFMLSSLQSRSNVSTRSSWVVSGKK